MNNEPEPQASAPAEPMIDTVTTIRRLDWQREAGAEAVLAGEELIVEPEEVYEVALSHPRPAPVRPSSVPPPPPLAALRAAARSSWPTTRARSSTPPPPEPTPVGPGVQPSADATTELLAVRAELERVARRMRARDAYLVELERAFDASNRQLETGRSRTAADTARLLGRVRGQAYRIAELEAELRQAIVALATERASPGNRELPKPTDLQLVRGIGPRFEAQLRAMGIATLANVAGWSSEDVARVAEQLNIRPQRIERDAWVDQARALSAGRK
jgi:predicted flap endonuclease-1-like 5' DNA nuclease